MCNINSISTMTLYIFMTGISIIKIISVTGAIPIQSQLSHHPQINRNTFLQGLVTAFLIECIQQSLYKVLVHKTMIVVVFCILLFFFFCHSVLVYIILIVCMNIDFFNKCVVRKLTLPFYFLTLAHMNSKHYKQT